MRQNLKVTMSPDPTPDPVGLDKMGLSIDVLIPESAWLESCEKPAIYCERAVRTAIGVAIADGFVVPETGIEVAVTLTSDHHVRELNRNYRNIDKSTNVLSFANLEAGGTDQFPDGAVIMLGDVIVAHETVLQEAKADGKIFSDHLTHMIAHGVLHLLGYDHQSDGDANHMEALEIEVLSRLGVGDPYARSELNHDTKDKDKGNE